MIEKGNNSIDEIIGKIGGSKSILILTHKKPDGDAAGSVFALAEAIEKKYDARVQILFEEYNRKFNLISTHKINQSVQNINGIELAIALDCGSKERLGIFEGYFEGKRTINIDHHISNTFFGEYNFVDPSASSTCEIIYEFIKGMDALDEKNAMALYAGIISDTGGFRHSCTTSKTHTIAAELIKFDFPFTHIYNKLMIEKTYDEAIFLSQAIRNLEIIPRLNLAISYLTFEQIEKADKKFTGGLVEFIKNISDIEIAVMIIENEKNNCRLSFRSDKTDVNEIAKKFNGGGHKFAAGGNMLTNIRATKEKVIQAIEGKSDV